MLCAAFDAIALTVIAAGLSRPPSGRHPFSSAHAHSPHPADFPTIAACRATVSASKGSEEIGGTTQSRRKIPIPMATRPPPPQSSPAGSVTVTVDPSPSSSASAPPPSTATPAPVPAEAVVLRLKRRAKKKVSWKEGTVDNEGLGRKSSKKCCIFHKEVPFDEDNSDDEAPGGGHRCPQGDAGEGTSGSGGGGCSSSSHDHSHHHH